MRTAHDVEQIYTDPSLYERIGISQGFRVGDLVFVSGQVGNERDGEMAADFATQAEEAFENLAHVLEIGGSSMENVIKVTIYVTDIAANYAKVVECRRRHFTHPYPADTIAEVRALARPEFQIEIEAIAVAIG